MLSQALPLHVTMHAAGRGPAAAAAAPMQVGGGNGKTEADTWWTGDLQSGSSTHSGAQAPLYGDMGGGAYGGGALGGGAYGAGAYGEGRGVRSGQGMGNGADTFAPYSGEHGGYGGLDHFGGPLAGHVAGGAAASTWQEEEHVSYDDHAEAEDLLNAAAQAAMSAAAMVFSDEEPDVRSFVLLFLAARTLLKRQRSIPGHSIAAVRALKSSVSVTAGGGGA